jgi:AraC family transcriptional regulator
MRIPPTRYEDVYREAIILSSRTATGCGWEGFTVNFDRFEPFACDFPGAPEYHFCLNVGRTAQLTHSVDGLRFSGPVRRGDFLFVPALWRAEWDLGTQAAALSIRLNSDFVRRVAGSDPEGANRVDLIAQVLGREPQVWLIGQTLLNELRTNGENGPLFASEMATALCRLALRAYSARPEVSADGGRPGPTALNRAREYILDNLARPLTVTRLAAVAGMRVRDFSRQFRMRWGVPPHEYQLRARIERARALLRTGEHDLPTLALTLGFCDQSHFHRHFRRIVGLSPGAFRDEGGGAETFTGVEQVRPRAREPDGVTM